MTASSFSGFGVPSADPTSAQPQQGFAPPAAQPQQDFGPLAAPQTSFGGNLNTNLGGNQPAARRTESAAAHADASGFGLAENGGTFVKLADLAAPPGDDVNGGIVILRPLKIVEVPDKFNPGTLKEKAEFDMAIFSTGPKPEMSQYASTFLPKQSSFGGFIIGSCRRAIDERRKWIVGRLSYVPTAKGNPGLQLLTNLNDQERAAAGALLVVLGQETPETMGITDPAQLQAIEQWKASLT